MDNRIVNFTKAFINHASNGFQRTSNEAATFRVDTCQKCENFNPLNVTCNLCGCYLAIKVGWASEKCPIDKWGPDINSIAVDMDGVPISTINSNNENIQVQSDVQLNQIPKCFSCNKNV
jgi:hypothetical protein